MNEDTLLDEPLEPLPPDIPQTAIGRKVNKLLKENAAQQERTWTYYQDLKKKDEKRYWSPKVQFQMHNDAIALQDKFGFPGSDDE
jgi:hypothetical protein